MQGPPPLEKAVAGEIKRALEGVGYHVSSTQQARASRQTEGMPDLWVAHPAWRVFAWIEVKRPGGKATKVQREWHEIVRASGCPVLIADSAADALRQLEAIRASRR